MQLTTQKPKPITPAAIEAICCLPDDLYRLRWVSYAYYDIARRLATRLGNDATWPAFARWSAYTISEALRLDQVNPRLEEVLREHALPPSVTGPLVAVQRRLRSLDDGAMPTVLALGNRMVFHEIGWTLTKFLDWIEKQPASAKWSAQKRDRYIAANVNPLPPDDFFRPCYPEWLREGVAAYYDAWYERDPHKRAQHVLRGNILIGAYEQWRVDSYFEIALDFNPGALVKDLRLGPHDDIGIRRLGVRRAGTRRALRHQWAMFDWMSDAYAAFLTQFVMTWDASLFGARPSALRLGCDVPARRRSAVFAHNLEKLDPDAARLFALFDRSCGELRGSGARNWRRFTDRMSFIVNLFRSQQQNPNLMVPPSFLETRLLELQLNDAHLDRLRGIGDPRYDDDPPDMGAHFANPEAFAKGFVDRGKPYKELRRHQEVIPLPRWVDRDKIEAGQRFFEAYSMEIASALFCASLPMAYTAARGSRVLLETAQLVSNVKRRITETGRLLFAVLEPDPGGRPEFEPGSRAYTTLLAIRGFHAGVRRMLREREPWKSEWTVPMSTNGSTRAAAKTGLHVGEIPINQEDLLGTLATFTVVVIEALAKMGVDVSDDERDAYLHTWLVAGYLMGIDYDLLRARAFNEHEQPLTYFEMQLLRDAIFRRQAAPSPSGQILTRALLGLQEAAVPRILRPLPSAAIRRFIGDDAADMLEVPPAGPIRVAVDALGPIGSATDAIAQGRVVRPRLAEMASRMFQQWMAEELGTPVDWSSDHLFPVSHLSPQIDLAEAERRLADAPPLWAKGASPRPARANGSKGRATRSQKRAPSTTSRRR